MRSQKPKSGITAHAVSEGIRLIDPLFIQRCRNGLRKVMHCEWNGIAGIRTVTGKVDAYDFTIGDLFCQGMQLPGIAECSVQE